ncbi:hypothetical protein F5884DRAFT_322937 [Xylogone sp. PMI_703]|nr:hypothetical protein F5884DRAFT_322937 [Xylogone sp. PMI_703]
MAQADIGLRKTWFAVMVRLLGVQEFTIVPNVLDDTGSTFFELYADDAQRLGLTQSYGGWGRRVSLNTANGKIRRQIFAVEIQLLLNGVPFGDITRISATLTPTNSDGDYRCSGTWLRKLWFTATSPYGNDSLYMSDRKTGVVRPLPS